MSMLILPVIVAGAIATLGDSVATTVVHLDTVASPQIGAHAYSMSVGPMHPWGPDTTHSGELTLVMMFSRRLRVTLYKCERSEWLTIDDILVGTGDSRQITAQYTLPVFPRLEGLSIRPTRAGVLLPRTHPPTVTWESPDVFFVPYHQDTLFVEHLRDDEFKITARARMDYVTPEEYNRIIDSLRVRNNASGQQGQ